MFFVLPFIQERILRVQNGRNGPPPEGIQRVQNGRNGSLSQGIDSLVSPSKTGAGILIRTLAFQRPKVDYCVKVHVDIWLEDGTKVDSTRDRNQPLVFRVGAKEVIEGLEIAVQRLSVGQLVEVTIPSLYAYGERGRMPEVPPQSTLVARLELLAFSPRGCKVQL